VQGSGKIYANKKGGDTMNDLKTTLTGVITGIVTLLSFFNIIIPEAYVPVIVAVGVAVLGYFSAQEKKTP
jgi:hypothetical protein